jgi:FkbM family methyltransferase
LIGLIHLLWARSRTWRRRAYAIGGHEIILPPGHKLDWYRLRHPRYDEPVGEISDILFRKYNLLLSIDIGANVGDTAALMVKGRQCNVLCVEGNPRYTRLLKSNALSFCPRAEFELSYIGEVTEIIHASVKTSSGTASIAIDAVADGSKVELISFDMLIARHIAFAEAHLLKIDTDGFDPNVLESAKGFLATHKPVIYFEMDPLHASNSKQKCKRSLEILRERGYDKFHVFDNFGTHLLRIESDRCDIFDQLLDYPIRNRSLRAPALYYFDICAIHPNDDDVSDGLLSKYGC